MSQTEPDLEKYRGTAGAEVKTADVSSDDHDLKKVLGKEDAGKERRYDPKIAGERFVQFYDDSAAAIREYLSNAETACIRRARNELLDADVAEEDIPSEVSKLLDMAQEVAGYEPLIEVTYNRQSDATRFIIEDNGIGISTEEYQVVQRIGYSTSHSNGERLGQFGMGWMSGFQLTSVNGVFKMFTKSYLTDEAYGTAEYVANCEFLDIAPQEYGTRFEFPGFGEAAKEIDIPSKVEEFAEGMSIPVLYRDFDESGDETSLSDDFLPRRMENDYPDDALVVVYENEYFKAAMSPARAENRRGLLTYNVTMPIRRNCDTFGSEPRFNAKWKWDFRGKKEDGPIVACESDESVVGLVPKEDSKYDRLMDGFEEKCIPMSEVPDDAIVMPSPASSRDSYKSGHDDFWNHVSEKLEDRWKEIAAERFEDLSTWDDFLALDRSEKQALFRAYSHFGPKYSEVTPTTVQDTIYNQFGTIIKLDTCEKLHESKSSVNVVRRGSNRAHTKNACHGKTVWKVIDEANDVYMGVSVSQKKADIAWDLHDDNAVVRVDSTDKYAEYEEQWGWKKLKDLPSRNLKEKLPELSDSIIEMYDGTSASASNNTASTGGNGKDPSTYRGKVRWGVGSRKRFDTMNMGALKDSLEQDGEFRARYTDFEYLVIRPDDESARDVAGHAKKNKRVAAVRLPKYVYDYMEGTSGVYTCRQDVVDENRGVDVTLSDGTTMNITDLPETDVLLIGDGAIRDFFEDRPKDLLSLYGYDTDEFDRVSWVGAGDVSGSWNATTDATVVKTGCSHATRDFNDYKYHSDELRDLKLRDRLGADVDTSSDKYDVLFGYRYGEPDGSTLDTLLDIAEEIDLPTTDDSS